MARYTGKELGRYVLGERIGQGGMGTVYRATSSAQEKPVAIKILYPQFSDDEDYLARFRRETSITTELEHPNIVTLLDYGEDDQLGCYQVLELVEGQSLRGVLEDGRPPLERSVALTKQLLQGLAYAHQKGIVHRDIKPDNLLLDSQGNLVISDFGVALAPDRTNLTRTGFMPGTPDYMSPEQLGQKEVGPASDLYAVGIVLYELTAGKTPFAADNVAEVIQRQVYQLPQPPSYRNPDLPRGLDQLILKALEKDPKDRFQSAQDMLAALENVDLAAAPQRSEPEPPPEPTGEIEPTVMVKASLRPVQTALAWWLVPLLLVGLSGALGWQAIEKVNQPPFWYQAGTGSVPVAGYERLMWAFTLNGCETALMSSQGALTAQDQAAALADLIALQKPQTLKLVEEGDDFLVRDEQGRDLIRVTPQLALQLQRPPEAVARYWMALTQDQLSLRAGREPSFTRRHERDYPLRPNQEPPRSPLLQRVYQRARHRVRDGELSVAVLLEAIESLPEKEKKQLRQAARSIPVEVPD